MRFVRNETESFHRGRGEPPPAIEPVIGHLKADHRMGPLCLGHRHEPPPHVPAWG